MFIVIRLGCFKKILTLIDYL